MNGSMIEFRTNGGTPSEGSASGYLSLPAAKRGPGVLVLQEWWGLVDHIKDVADRFAAAGYVALAPDLYRGEQSTSPTEAQRLLMALDIADTARMLRGGAEFLLAHDAVFPKRVGAVGFCMGGHLALYAATAHPDVIGAVVDFYGIFNPSVPVDLSALKAPVLAHFGRTDKSVPPEKADALMASIKSTGARCDAYQYEAGHAFFNDARPQVYDEASAKLAWQRTLAFFRETLT